MGSLGKRTWDSDSQSGLIAAYALTNADAVARLFLPLIGRRDGSRITWAEYLDRHGELRELDGYSEWRDISEISGTGSSGDSEFYPAPWSADLSTVYIATSVLNEFCGDGSRWNLVPEPVFGYDREIYTGCRVVELWTTRSFPGRVWNDGCGVALASPAYADSIIVSGPALLIEMMRSRGLEIYRVARSHRLPSMIL